MSHSIHDPTETHFLIGYGSLINAQSRLRSLSTHSQALPVVCHGYKRRWGYRCPRREYTALSVERVQGSSINAVLIPITSPEIDIPRLDERERNYARTLVDLHDLVVLLSPGQSQSSPLKSNSDIGLRHTPFASIFPEKSTNAFVWIYTIPNDTEINYSLSSSLSHSQSLETLKSHQPSAKCPIPQSYLDCVLSGCLKYGIEFAREFIKSTDCWAAGCWVNDRHSCSRHRKYICQQDVGETVCAESIEAVDVLLMDLLPHQYFNRACHSSCESLQ
jgi:hypothetical protein